MIKICISITTLLIVLTYIINKKSAPASRSQYECGIEPFHEGETSVLYGETREKFYLKFYIIGIIFLIFDLESILLYPIVFSPALSYLQTSSIINNNQFLSFTNYPPHTPIWVWEGDINYTGYIVFLIFMFFLILGLIYEYKKKVLN